jgi:hypothetical protein
MASLDVTSLDALADDVMAHVDVLRPRRRDRVGRDVNGGLVVFVDDGRALCGRPT